MVQFQVGEAVVEGLGQSVVLPPVGPHATRENGLYVGERGSALDPPPGTPTQSRTTPGPNDGFIETDSSRTAGRSRRRRWGSGSRVITRTATALLSSIPVSLWRPSCPAIPSSAGDSTEAVGAYMRQLCRRVDFYPAINAPVRRRRARGGRQAR
jgi:hypothetical protein